MKLRGHTRIHKAIKLWQEKNLRLDLENLKIYQRDYCKVWVRPFSDITLSDKPIPKPKGKNRKLIIEGLLAIFNNWEQQLQTLNEPYYLAIWLFDPDVEKSQVVCAIGDMLNFYDITFFRPEHQKKIATQNYGKLKPELDKFEWVQGVDEGYFTNIDIEEADDMYDSCEDSKQLRKWYKRRLAKKHRAETDEFDTTTYFYTMGNVYIGTKNKL